MEIVQQFRWAVVSFPYDSAGTPGILVCESFKWHNSSAECLTDAKAAIVKAHCEPDCPQVVIQTRFHIQKRSKPWWRILLCLK